MALRGDRMSGPEIVIGIIPEALTLDTGASFVFQAVLLNTEDTRVTWSTEPPGFGVVSGSLFTAPDVAGAGEVIATSVVDPSKQARASVTVRALLGQSCQAETDCKTGECCASACTHGWAELASNFENGTFQVPWMEQIRILDETSIFFGGTPVGPATHYFNGSQTLARFNDGAWQSTTTRVGAYGTSRFLLGGWPEALSNFNLSWYDAGTWRHVLLLVGSEAELSHLVPTEPLGFVNANLALVLVNQLVFPGGKGKLATVTLETSDPFLVRQSYSAPTSGPAPNPVTGYSRLSAALQWSSNVFYVAQTGEGCAAGCDTAYRVEVNPSTYALTFTDLAWPNYEGVRAPPAFVAIPTLPPARERTINGSRSQAQQSGGKRRHRRARRVPCVRHRGRQAPPALATPS